MKIRIKYIMALLLIIVAQHTYGQSFVPQNMGQEINSPYDDINPVISPDGRTLFFTRVNHPENTYGERDSEDIWVSYLSSNNKWSTAQRLTELNIGRYNAVLSISADGQTLLLNGIYNKKGNIWKKRGLSVSTRSGNTWSTPEKLKVKKFSKQNRGMKSSASMSADGEYIVMSFTKWYNGEHSKLFVSKKKNNGKWNKPKKIRSLHSNRSEDTPFLSTDNKTLYFSSNIVSKKDYNIYKATRTGTDWKHWTYPEKLSDTINSPGWEAYFKTTIKGSVAYFSSTNKSNGKADIFKVKLFEENPVVIVSGSVVNSKTGKALKGRPFTILVNGEPNDSTFINTDSATFKVKLPLGKSYTLAAAVKNYESQILAVDVSTVKEFSKMKIDLYVDPQPYVIVSGKMLIRNTDSPIPASANPTILIDGQAAKLISVDRVTGDYSLKIAHGKMYNISVDAKGYNTLPDKLDLTAIEEYQEIKKDVFVDENKMALVKGKIIDKKSGKALPYKSGLKIQVEGISTIFSAIDSATSEYELKLPLGSSYTISASVPNYYPVYEIINVSNETGNVKIFKDLFIAPLEVGQSIRLNNIFFETGKSVLKKESFPELDRVINFLTTSADIKIEIAGHTDNVGKAESNLKLSQARAKSVATYIITKGIAADRITAKGYGLTKPVASNQTAAGKSQNRRVEFTILDK